MGLCIYLKIRQAQPAQPAQPAPTVNFEELISKARKEEKEKLYPKITKLKEQIDEKELENYWEEVVEDLEKDPDWFTFADE